ncbi:BatD family protein [Legionella waltersii]|uniref:KQDN repeat-containing protein n=1 Tax=Legionella waltersii TaxID=66969 RepID=A0A0W1A4U9_9GAMM|nr:BatD family protein [Legionella waltersii]KTD76356.1 KQDN repeat-containing protein [Legionella waltersii]SNV13921.1 KQDN repeat-containing protein [Legionella waltersii]
MKKRIAWCLFLVTINAWSEVQVQIDPPEVTMGETFRLLIVQENNKEGGVPDLSVLQKDFAILGTERQVNYTVINGQTQYQSQWTVLLRALKNGAITIPSIKVGVEQSAPLTINVQGAGDTSTAKDTAVQQQDVMLITEVDQKKPYVNQQIIYKVKLYISKRFLDTDYQGPKVDDALLIPLGEARRYHEVQNNINYVVEEQIYAIYPQKSGVLRIVSPTFNAIVYDYNPQKVKAQDKTIELTVQPAPKEYQGKEWLPATQVHLTEHYENTSQSIAQGSTLTRTITLEAVAIPAQLLPTLNFAETDAFNVYPEKGAEKNEIKQGKLVGSVELKVTYLFNKAGKTTIPELRLPWFNTETGKQEIAVLPPRSIDITPSATATISKSNMQEKSSSVVAPTIEDKGASHDQEQSWNWSWALALFFASAWVATLGLFFFHKHLGFSNRRSYKKALHELNKACQKGEPEKARDAVLKWAALQWPDAPLLNLSDLARIVRDIHLKKQLNLLTQVIYKSHDKTLWRGDELWRAVKAVQKSDVGSRRKNNSLPPINPT